MTGRALTSQDVTALQAALAAEQVACYGYGVVGAYLQGAAAVTADADWIAHQEARDRLTAIISSTGVPAAPAAVAYQLPVQVHAPGQARALAAMLEDAVARAYVALVAVTDPGLRMLGAAGLRSAALRAASWSQQTVAFPGLPDG